MVRKTPGTGNVETLLSLLRAYSLQMTRAVDGLLGSVFIENAHFLAFADVFHGPPRSVTDLAVAYGLERRNLARFFGKLEERGLVVISASEFDRRARVVAMAPGSVGAIAAFERGLDEFFVSSATLAHQITREAVPGGSVGASRGGVPSADAFDLTVLVAETGIEVQGAIRAELGDVLWDSLRGHRILALSVVGRTSLCRPTALVDELGLTPAGVTQLVAGLEADGFLQRRNDVVGDRRGVRIALTSEGRYAAGALAAAIDGQRATIAHRFGTIYAVASAA